MANFDTLPQSKKSGSGRGGKRPGAGRKPGPISALKKSLQELARPHAQLLLQELLKLATSPSEAGSVRVAAIKEILDRGYGKAPQAITGENGEGDAKLILQVVTGVPRDG